MDWIGPTMVRYGTEEQKAFFDHGVQHVLGGQFITTPGGQDGVDQQRDVGVVGEDFAFLLRA